MYTEEVPVVVFKMCFCSPPPHVGVAREEPQGGSGEPIISPDVPHGGRKDAPLEKKEGGNRKTEATRGKAKRRTRKIKMIHGTGLKNKSGMTSSNLLFFCRFFVFQEFVSRHTVQKCFFFC